MISDMAPTWVNIDERAAGSGAMQQPVMAQTLTMPPVMTTGACGLYGIDPGGLRCLKRELESKRVADEHIKVLTSIDIGPLSQGARFWEVLAFKPCLGVVPCHVGCRTQATCHITWT